MAVVHRRQERERRTVVAQRLVITAVQLDQHARSGHPLATYPVHGCPSAPGALQSGLQQYASQGSPADVDAFALAQQFAQLGVDVSKWYRVYRAKCTMSAVTASRSGADRSAAPVAMGREAAPRSR